MSFDVAILGPPIVGPSGDRPLAGQLARVLGVLALTPGQPVSTTALARWALGEDQEDDWSRVHVLVSRLRRVFKERLVASEVRTVPNGYLLAAASRAVDASLFEQLVANALGLADESRRQALLADALALWRGDVLHGVGLDDHPSTHRLQDLRDQAHDEHFAANLRVGDHVGSLPAVLERCRCGPIRERRTGLAMVALALDGRQPEALNLFADIRARLRSDHGLEPGSDLCRVEAAVLANDVEWLRAHVTAGPKNTATTEAPMPSPTGTGRLPASVGTFVGRSEERHALQAALDAHRLVTLCGPGGMGKTALALEVARARPSTDPVWFVDLAALATDTSVEHAVAQALGLDQHTGSTPRQAIITSLSNRAGLVVLDNCEHVLTAAASLVDDALREAPGVSILATSRQPLHLLHEQVVTLGPLNPRDQIALFRERAAATGRALDLDEVAVAAVCGALDGMPLAIHLAAAKLRTLSLAEIALHVGDENRMLGATNSATARHRSLDALVDWSYNLLDDTERRMLTRVAVFRGGFDAQDAHAICANSHRTFDTTLLLASLADQSLVNVTDHNGIARYRLLETIRQYAWNRLGPDSTQLEERHAAHFADKTERSQAQRSPATATGTARVHLDLDFDNIRQAIAWSLANDHTDLAGRLVGHLTVFSELRPNVEVAQWIDDYLQHAVGAIVQQRIRAHLAASVIRTCLADWSAAERHARDALDLAVGTDDALTVSALTYLAPPVAYQGDPYEALRLVNEAHTLAVRLDRPVTTAAVGYVRTYAALYANQHASIDVDALHRTALRSSSPAERAYTLGSLGTALLAAGDPQAANIFEHAVGAADEAGHMHMRCLHRALTAHARGYGDPLGELASLRVAIDTYGAARLPFGPPQIAANCLGSLAALKQWDTIALLAGAAPPVSLFPDQQLHAITASRAQLGNSTFDTYVHQGRHLSHSDLSRVLTERLDRLGVSGE